MHLIKVFNTSLLAFLTVVFSAFSYAIDYTDLAAYEIEVVIFSSNQTRAAGSEIWPDLVETVSVENSVELHDNTSLDNKPGVDKPGYYYSKIPANKLRLIDEAEKLEKSDKYKVIYHSAWIQPGLDQERAESIHIKSDMLNDVVEINPIKGLTNTLPSYQPTQLLMPTEAQQQPDSTSLLDGVVKVELGRYLHIHFDLKYQRNLAPQEGVINTQANAYKDIKFYPVQTHRRMRSKEIHYIDHPLIGILVLATPFELPKEKEPEPVNRPLYKLNNIPVAN